MDANKQQKLIDRVIEQIKSDLNNQDETAIDCLLTFVPNKQLIQFLPEEEWKDYKE